MTEISEKEVEAARAVLERRIYDEGRCEAEQVPAMVREMLEAAALSRAGANAGGPVAWGEDIDGKIVSVRLDKSRHCTVPLYPAPQPSGTVKALDEDDYEEIISAAAINMRKATSGIRGQVITVQDSLDWWVMKETERRILSALTAGKPEQSGWKPIETAPKDGTDILGWHEIAGTSQTRFSEGEWMCPDWDEDRYIHCTWSPTHWMPLPTPPTAGGGDV